MPCVLLVGPGLDRRPPTLREALERAGFSVHVCPVTSAEDCAATQCWAGVRPDAVVIRESLGSPLPPCAEVVGAPTLIVEEGSGRAPEIIGSIGRIGQAQGPMVALQVLERLQHGLGSR